MSQNPSQLLFCFFFHPVVTGQDSSMFNFLVSGGKHLQFAFDKMELQQGFRIAEKLF